MNTNLNIEYIYLRHLFIIIINFMDFMDFYAIMILIFNLILIVFIKHNF